VASKVTKVPVPGGEVSVARDGSASDGPVLILAPGAGAPMTSDFMTYFASRIGGAGVRVFRFNFLYLEAGKKAPDRAPVLEATYAAVIAAIRDETGALPFAGGKSMGGRIASHTAAGIEGPASEVAGLVFLGYPLHPPGRPERIRDAHLYGIGAPMLFVEGTRDPFCPLDTLAGVRQKIPNSDLFVVEDGDHSFKVRKSSGRSTEEAWAEAADEVARWIAAQGG
jgi:predicted alpha/beta-hydrolase family hydrolase